MIDWIQTKALGLLLAAIPMGLVASLLYQAIKRVLQAETTLLSKTPKALHRVYFAITVTFVTSVSLLLGVPIACPEDASCVSALDQETLKRLLEVGIPSLLAGLGAHAGVKKLKGEVKPDAPQ